jgi:UDP-N-acetylglucosamine--N-acetylmuramyl-(pentapeptide) pyrophosphoryl-undecaprenol N-acetylglucosamine transferase
VDAVSAVWLGRAGSLEERLVSARGLVFRPLAAAPLVGVGPLGALRNLVTLARGTAQAWHAAAVDRPSAALVTGGYVSVPVALAAWLRRIPLLVYLPDVRPGRAVATIAKIADCVAVTVPEACGELPAGKCVVTGYPVRPALRAVDRAAGRAALGLAADRPVLLVFGGSQGARRLNEAVVAAAPELLGRCQVVHLTGPKDLAAVRAARGELPGELARHWHAHEYLHDAEMAAALAGSDLAVCRAGAATLGELPAVGLPAVLVPLPISGGHQAPNARVLEAAGAAEVVPDAELDGPRLLAVVGSLLGSPGRLAAMAEAMARLDRPGAAEAIWAELERLVAGRPGRAA